MKNTVTRDWRNVEVLIIGAARQGIALARYLAENGARVVLNDLRPLSNLEAARNSLADLTDRPSAPIKWECGSHHFGLLEGKELVCVSGGVPLSLPLLVEARIRQIPLSNDSQIFLQSAPCLVIGITGSAGKTTTTSLVGHIAGVELEFLSNRNGDSRRPESDFRKVWVGGNIGTPLITDLDKMSANDLVVMELSSFQLELMECSPKIAALLNVTPNHLDRHKTMDAYKAAKARLLDFQTIADIAILGRDDPGAWSLQDKVRGDLWSFGMSELPEELAGVYLRESEIILRTPGRKQQLDAYGEYPILSRADIALRGDHNLQNVLAASAIAGAAGISPRSIGVGIREFRGVQHRLEFVRKWGDADWYNDSIATAPERAMAAIRSFNEPLILLAGGRDKDLPWRDFAYLVLEQVDHIIIFGEAREKILTALKEVGEEMGSQLLRVQKQGLMITVCTNLYAAVQEAATIVEAGDVVLLSPGGTSFDEFRDFEERGACFTHWVNELP